MKVSRLKVAIAALNIVLFTSVLFIGLIASQAPPYDPWLDVTDDGYGGIDDIVSTAEHFGASGDPSKLCNITGWPRSTAITVWWGEVLNPGDQRDSGFPRYSTDGFRYIHILVYVEGLSIGETMVWRLRSPIYNFTGTSARSVTCLIETLNNTITQSNVAMLVPGHQFDFRIKADNSNFSPLTVYLGFLLS